MKYFVTGVNGQLGHDLLIELEKRGFDYLASDITDTYQGAEDINPLDKYIKADITDMDEISQGIKAYGPSCVIHCAAWTKVDDAEDEEKRDLVFKINGEGTSNIAKICKEISSKMIYISTDYVFDGQGEKPWKPDDKSYKPLNIYGESKLRGELSVAENLEKFFIVRIAWVFGKSGTNFIKTMLNLGQKYDEIRVVNDQIGTPTYTKDLSRLLVDMSFTDRFGYYHATNEGGFISWYDFACEIMKRAGLSCRVNPVTTEEYGLSKARRPFNSRLDKSKLYENGFKPLRPWQEALGEYIDELLMEQNNGTD